MTEYKPPVKSMRMLHVNLSDTFSIVNMLKVSKHTSCDKYGGSHIVSRSITR